MADKGNSVSHAAGENTMRGNRPWRWCRFLLPVGVFVTMTAAAQARSLQEVHDSGVLRICVAGSSASFYQANGEAFARFLAVRPEVTRLDSWDVQFQNAAGVIVKEARYEPQVLADGRCDVLPNDLHITDWRQTKMLLVSMYTTRKMVVAHREQRKALTRLQDLAGRTAVVQKETAYDAWLQQQNATVFAANPVLIRHMPTAESMKQVAERGADFTVIGAEAAFKWVRGDLGNLDLMFPVDAPVDVGWGLRPGADSLAARLANFFEESRHPGSEVDRAWQQQYGISLAEYQLFNASFGSGGPGLRDILAWGLPLSLGVLGILAAILVWNRRLKREIAEHRRTEAALEQSRQAMAQESSRRQALATVSVRLQRATSIAELSAALLSELALLMPIGQGVFYVQDHESGQLRAVAQYAGEGGNTRLALDALPTTGGLLDSCVATRQPVLIESPGANYLRIRLGTGDIAPAQILLHPVMHQDRLHAILEIATLQPMTGEHAELLSDLDPVIAMSLDIIGQSERTRGLLNASQQAEEHHQRVLAVVRDGVARMDLESRQRLGDSALTALFGHDEREDTPR